VIELKRTVVVKVLMTPDFRAQLMDEARDTIRRIEENIAKLAQAAEDAPGVEAERVRLARLCEALDWRMREVENVSDGAELPFRILEGSVPIRVGDDFQARMANAEIILKDWQVVEIREG